MGLSSFPSPAEGGVLPVLVMNTVLSAAILKNMVRSVLHVVGANNNGITNSLNSGEEEEEFENINDSWRARRVSITRFESMCNNDNNKGVSNCCVCLSRFREEEEVSELMWCKHFFHRGCLDKWFDNQHFTCPLCRSIM
ncbi:hypothetical protein LguiA_000187 [Lonicera macranthoides]